MLRPYVIRTLSEGRRRHRVFEGWSGASLGTLQWRPLDNSYYSTELLAANYRGGNWLTAFATVEAAKIELARYWEAEGEAILARRDARLCRVLDVSTDLVEAAS